MTRSQQWRDIAEDAFTLYEAAPGPTKFQAFTYSQALLATGRLFGWDDPRVGQHIDHIMAVRNPDGGWGIDDPRDEFNDGSVNPDTTTYTVTLAGHAGPALLAARKAGVFTDPEPLQKITSLLMSTAHIDTGAGVCVAYSRAPADAAGATYCVHNVNAGVAAYLTDASANGFGARGLQAMVARIVKREISAWNGTSALWPYKDTAALADPDHNSYEAESLYFLAYPIGREAAYQLLAAPATNDDGRRAHLRLPALGGGPGSWDPAGTGATLWAVMGDQYLGEAQDYVTSRTGDAATLAQAAALASATMAATE